MPQDGSDSAHWAVRHPVLWGLLSAIALFGLSARLFDGNYWPVWGAVAMLFGLLNYWLWRASGPGHRARAYLLRRYPKR